MGSAAPRRLTSTGTEAVPSALDNGFSSHKVARPKAGGNDLDVAAKRALITGITGQDGSYLAEFLLTKGYTVVGLVRSSSVDTYERIDHLRGDITLLDGDMLDSGSLMRAIQDAEPDELYNLASQSYGLASFGQPAQTAEVTAVGGARILEAVREINPRIRFYQASSSEMFGAGHDARCRRRQPGSARCGCRSPRG